MIANPHNMFLPGLESVSYPPKKINTVAVKVTPDNIGALSIEFESELLYSQTTGQPYFYADFQREEGHDPATISVRLGDWIVVLWDQYRIFRENEFMNTFRLNYAGPLPQKVTDPKEYEAVHGIPWSPEEVLELREEGVHRETVHDDSQP